MIGQWIQEAWEEADRWLDAGFTEQGLHVLKELANTAPREVLLATDLHAGNVLRSQREPWLVIDPKPFYGDPAYDATQHLLNCQERLRANPATTIGHFSDLLGVDSERVRLWTFARLAADGAIQESQVLARMLMP
jgi:streptomycin 6-kinase